MVYSYGKYGHQPFASGQLHSNTLGSLTPGFILQFRCSSLLHVQAAGINNEEDIAKLFVMLVRVAINFRNVQAR